MKCERCHGNGQEPTHDIPIPCEECSGSGVVSCCEGRYDESPDNLESLTKVEPSVDPPGVDGVKQDKPTAY